MKNATRYEKKVRKLLRGLSRQGGAAPDPADPVRALIESVLQADASPKHAERAIEAMEGEFVDRNELRVAPPKEVVESIGRNYPHAARKAQMLKDALGGIYARCSEVSMEYMRDMTKRDLRRHLSELGLDPYSVAYVTLMAFGGHAVPVDGTLVECLEMSGYVHPGSSVEDVQGFLERIIPYKNAVAAHAALWRFVAKSAKALARKRQAEAKVRAAAEAVARAEAEAAEKARLAREEAARAKKAKKAKKLAGEVRRKARKASKRSRAPRPARKTSRTKPAGAATAKRSRKKVARKSSPKTRKTAKASKR